MLKSFVALASHWFATIAIAQERGTAYEAMRVLSSHLGRASLNHVISVNGTNGDPQPETWKILLEDSRSPTGTREVEIASGRVVGDRTPERVVIGSARNSTIKTARLNLDSSGAFQVA